MTYFTRSISLFVILTCLLFNRVLCSRKGRSQLEIRRLSKQHSRKTWFPTSSLGLQHDLRGGSESVQNSDSGKKLLYSGALVTSLWLLWTYREGWMGVFDKDKLQTKTLEILRELNALPKYKSYTVYTLGMALWEAVGLSTIPVETAAGMVFGWPGFALSASGKLLGAVLAFCLARYGILAGWIKERLSGNSFLQLVQDSAESSPILVTVLMKFSCFPETIKNYGSGILQPIQLWMFIFGTAVHGGTFSALWTYFGVDTAMRLGDNSIPADSLLKTLLTLALVNGIVVSPLAMAYWLKSLKEHSKQS